MRRPPPFRPRRLHVLAVVGLLSLILLTYGAIALAAFVRRPLGPALDLPAAAPEGDAQAASGSPQCDGPPLMTLLAVGIDAPSGDYATGFADVIRVARIDFVTPSATILDVPRDLWVAIPGLERQGIVENRIKAAYPYGFEYAAHGGGPGLLARTLFENFGLTVDHYLVVNFPAFRAGIDAIGGIDVDVPGPLGSPDGPNYFPAGPQHMDGATALAYARLRGGSSDLFRIQRQTDVLLAIRKKVLSPQVLPALPGLVQSMQGSVLTDLSPAQVSSLVCLAQKIDAADIHVVDFEESMTTSDEIFGFEILLPDYDAITELVRQFQAGELAPAP